MNRWNTEGFRVWRATVMNWLNPYCTYQFAREGTMTKNTFTHDFLNVLPILYCVLNWFDSVVWHHGERRIVPDLRASLARNSLMPRRTDSAGLWVSHELVCEVLLTQWWADAEWRLIDSFEMLTANTFCRAGSWLLRGRFTSSWSARDSVGHVRADQQQRQIRADLKYKKRSRNTKWELWRRVDMIIDQYQKLEDYFTRGWLFWFLTMLLAWLLGWQCWLVRSTTLVHAEISQQLLDRWVTLHVSGQSFNLSCKISLHLLLLPDVDGSQHMYPNDVGDPMAHPIVPPWHHATTKVHRISYFWFFF